MARIPLLATSPRILELPGVGRSLRVTTVVSVAAVLLAAAVGTLISTLSYRVLAALLGLCAAVMILRRPYFGFLLVVATLPADVLGTLGRSGGSFVLSITKLVGVLTVLAIVLDSLVRQRVPAVRRWRTPETVCVLLFTLCMLVSTVLHPPRTDTQELLRMITIVVFVLVTVHFVDSRRRLRQVVHVLVWVGTAVAAFSLIQRLRGAVGISEEWVAASGAVLDVGEEQIGEMLRSTGSFSHPGLLGLFLSVVAPLTLYVLWTSRHVPTQVMAAGALGVQVLGVFATYSRMSYIGVALGLVLFGARRRFGVVIVLALFAGAAAAFPFLPKDIQARAWSIVNYADSSSSLSRIGQQLAGWYLFVDHPWWGVGPGNYEAMAQDYARLIPEAYQVQAIGAHNLYVEVAAELGIPGLAVFAALVLCCAHRVRRLRRIALDGGEAESALLWECVGTAMAVFLVSAFFVHAQYAKEWWLLVALVAAGRAMAPDRRRRPVGAAAA